MSPVIERHLQTMTRQGDDQMYDYRMLFPHLGDRDVRREQEQSRQDLARERRATSSCVRPKHRTRRGRP
jgi:hypothetical protein